MAALAWGGAGALTALSVGVYTHRDRAPGWMSKPSFFETRTCFVEYVYSARDHHARKHGAGSGRELGALCYYYAPMALLVAGNAACLALTALRVRSLRRNSSLVLREGARSSPALRPLRT
ncbi:Protein of unknown function [Gryllus bimaculatus]|nr:Protein of unknown function [Gryllus bimaculatus]